MMHVYTRLKIGEECNTVIFSMTRVKYELGLANPFLSLSVEQFEGPCDGSQRRPTIRM